MSKDDIAPDKLDDALRREEGGEAGKMLRSTAEGIEPRPEFARQLEARLMSASRAGERAARQKNNTPLPEALPTRPTPIQNSKLKIQNSPPRRSALGRVAAFALGGVGVAAVAVMLVGLAFMLQARQGVEQVVQGGKTPVAGTAVPADTVNLVSAFAPQRTLQMGRAVQMAWSPDGKILAAVEWPGERGSDISKPLFFEDKVQLKMWDVEGGKLLSNETYNYIGSIDWAPEGSKLAVSAGEQSVHILNGEGRKLYSVTNPLKAADLPGDENASYLASYLDSALKSAPQVEWSSDGRFFALSFVQPFQLKPLSPDSAITVYDAATGEQARRIRVASQPSPTPGATTSYFGPLFDWSPDGQKFVVSETYSPVRVFDAVSSEELLRLSIPESRGDDQERSRWMGWARWSPDGRYIYVLSGGPIVDIYDGSTGQYLRSMPDKLMPRPVPSTEPLPPDAPEARYDPSEAWHLDMVMWSPDDKVFATSSNVKLRVWDPATGEKMHEQIIQGANNIAWSPGGGMMAFLNGGLDEGRVNTGVVTILETTNWTPVHTLTDRNEIYGTANSFVWSPDGRMIAVSGKEGIVLWGAASADPLPTGIPEPNATLAVPTAVPTAEWAIPTPVGSAVPPATPTPAPTIDAPTPTPIPTSIPQPTPKPPCGEWAIVPSPNHGKANNELYDVDALSHDDAWAVGYYSDSSVGRGNYFFSDYSRTGARALILHWDGNAWTQAPAPNPGSENTVLHAVEVISESEAWAVGFYRTGDGEKTLILRWDGVEWKQVPSPDPDETRSRLFGISALSSTDIWAVGGYGDDFTDVNPSKTLTLRWDGKEWKQVASPSPGLLSHLLYGVSAVSADDVWAVGLFVPRAGGGGGGMNPAPLSLHWNGTEWAVVPVPEGPNNLMGVAALSKNEAWAAGSLAMEGGSWSEALQWNGTSWEGTEVLPQPPDGFGPSQDKLAGIAALAPDSVWAVGSYSRLNTSRGESDTLVVHWNGLGWSQVPSPNAGIESEQGATINSLSAISMLPDSSGLAVGSTRNSEGQSRSLILRYTPAACP